MIQESMKRGEFDNLPGAGKPLKYTNYNPFVDGMTHKINEIMVNNGFSPEWVLLEKEIKKDIVRLRQILCDEKRSMKIGIEKLQEKSSDSVLRQGIEEGNSDSRSSSDFYLTPTQSERWRQLIESLRSDVAALNKQINHFNLVCPGMSRQMFHFDLDRESKKILSSKSKSEEIPENSRNQASIGTLDKFDHSTPNAGGFMKLLFSVFNR